MTVFACLKNKNPLIHAGLRTDDSDAVLKNPYLTREQLLHKPDEVINGHILGQVHVYDFAKLSRTHSKEALIDCGSVERFGLFLDQIKQFAKPIPVKGEMGIWYFDLDTMQKVKKPVEKSMQLF